MSGTTSINLPDGQHVRLPALPRTWTDRATGVPGDWLSAKGLNHDVGGAVAWHGQRPLFQGIQTIVQSIANATYMVSLTNLAEIIDNYQGHYDTSNPGRWYAPLSSTSQPNGDWYLITGQVPIANTSTTQVSLAGIRKNGVNYSEGTQSIGGTHNAVMQVIDLVQLQSNDYVELAAYQHTGAAINTVVSGKAATFNVRWVCIDPTNAAAATPALPSVHSWASTDIATASLTGAGRVPLNTFVRDLVNFLNNPPLARLTTSGGTQTIPTGSGTWTSLTWTSGGNLDNYTGWAAGTPTRYTCQRAGLYYIAGHVTLTEGGANSGYRASRLLVNGTTAYPGMSSVPATATANGTGIDAVRPIRLAAGDYVEVQVQQNQGSALTVSSGSGNSCRLVALWMGF